MSRLQIRRLLLVDYRQFRELLLDFTHPETGEPLKRVCFIGRNGTGKTSLLDVLSRCALSFAAGRAPMRQAVLEVQHGDATVVVPHGGHRPVVVPELELPPATVVRDSGYAWRAWRLDAGATDAQSGELKSGRDIIAHSRAESATNQGVDLGGVPSTNLSEALALAKDFPLRHDISSEHIRDMWKLLVYLVKKRDSDREEYERDPENLQKTKAQLIAEFDALNPPVLRELAELWNRLLAPAGLEFDVDSANIPIQLTDNLSAHIKRRGTGDVIHYGALSSGIRDFMFRIGHLFLLFFRRRYESAFVLVDEPENSLFPDFLFELMELYDQSSARTRSSSWPPTAPSSPPSSSPGSASSWSGTTTAT